MDTSRSLLIIHKLNNYMNKKLITILLILQLPFIALSQETIGVGEWRGHFPYNSLISITSDYKGTIYAASNYSMFSYNVNTGLIDIFSKINYLSDIGISCIKYDTEHELLLIAYSNANIDILKNNKIINMNDIYRSSIIGNKTINNIFFKDKYAYLSCGFGIVVIDLVKFEIADTYYISDNGTYVNINDFTYMPKTHLFIAATNNGLYTANDSSNLAYYVNWHKITDFPNESSHFNEIDIFNDKLIANVQSDVFNHDTTLIYNGNEWSYIDASHNNEDVADIEHTDNELFLCCTSTIYSYDTSFKQTAKYWQYNDSTLLNVNKAIKVDNILWVADDQSGLAKFTNQWGASLIMPSGPEVSQAFKLVKYDKNILAVPGGFNISWVPLYNVAKFSVFSSNTWTTYSSKNISELSNYKDIADIVVDPRNSNRIFLASYSYGLIELLNNKVVNVYNGTNSPLLAPTGYTSEFVRCGGLAFDNNNNLWVSHALGSGVVNVLLSNNTWANAANGGLFTNLTYKEVSDITIDTYGNKWLKTREYGTIYVANDNGTPSDPSDDQWKKLDNSTGNGALSGQIATIAVDNDGEIWIGSDLGVKVIYYPNRIFHGGSYDAQDILIEYNGTVRPLLENESVTSIAVDYGNNKWIGTSTSGVYYVSADGTTEYQHFTKENSCLLSNDIIDIAIDYMGEVFFSTSNGICSYKGNSSEPSISNDDIYAYPNPVPPDYSGSIAVTGLVEDAHVKITDFAGKIVYAAISNGGMITWDGNLPNGKRASTGVYVVFATDENGKEHSVTKILFVK